MAAAACQKLLITTGSIGIVAGLTHLSSLIPTSADSTNNLFSKACDPQQI